MGDHNMQFYWRILAYAGCVVGALAQPLAHAEIYRMVDGQGNVTFTDTPIKGAQRMQLPPLSIVPGLTADQIAQANGQTAPPADTARVVSYRLSIVAPKANQSFQKPVDSIEIGAVTQPQLAGSDRLVILFDGKPLSEGNSAAVPTEGLDRGEHSISVQVLGADGRVLANESRSVFVIQPSVLQPKRRP